LFPIISRHVPLFIEETAMGLTATGSIEDNKSGGPVFKLSFDPKTDSGHTGKIREPLTGGELSHVLCDL
jgi:hypothetical protein